MEPKQLLDILHQAEKLKCNTRHCDTSSGRRESVAEHSWRISLMAMLIAGEFPDADMNKVIRMCLIHDLGESFTGDIPTFLKKKTDEDLEESVLSRWVDTFPSPEKEEWHALYREMNELSTVEAKIYKALDKMEAVIQHNESDISSWLPLEYDLQLKYGRENVTFSEYFQKLKEEIDQVTMEKIKTEGKSFCERKNQKIQAVIFDMDGVLVNTEPLHFRMWVEACKRRGLDLTYDVYKGCIGGTNEYLMELIYQAHGVDYRNDPTIPDDLMSIKKEIIRNEGYPRIKGVEQMLEALRQEGYPMAIASSSSPEMIDLAMENTGIGSYFVLKNSGKNVERSKPAPDIYLDTAKKLGVDPSHCVVLEDSTNGCRAAVAAGMTCIGFFNPDSGDQNLSAAVKIISDIRDFNPQLMKEL